MNLVRIYCTGLFISLMGALPLGTLNVTAMQLAVNEGISPAILFSLGALLVEVAYVRVSLVAINWVRKKKTFFKWLEWMGLIIVVILATGSFITAASSRSVQPVLFENRLPRIVMGMGMSALNPMQIPFWFGWSTLLFSRKILVPVRSYYNVYVAGIGTGTLLGHLVFIFAGRVLMEQLRPGHQLLNWAIGGVFAATAIILLIKILLKKDAVSQL